MPECHSSLEKGEAGLSAWSLRGILPADSATVDVEGIQDLGGIAYIEGVSGQHRRGMNLSGQGVLPEARAITYVQSVHASGIRTDSEHPSSQYAVGRRGITRGTPEFLACLALQGIHLTARTCFVVHTCVEHAMLYP